MSDLRELPSVDELSRDPVLAFLPATVRVQAARRTLDFARSEILLGKSVSKESVLESLHRTVDGLAMDNGATVINMSGVVLHTGLGRARLAPSVAKKIAEVAASHYAVELNLDDGKRGDRQARLRSQLRMLTGAEDALVVNNAAGAIVLALRAIAFGKDVLLSRGQMVEIGGSFRVPEIVRESGCRLLEVGCTNKTHLIDYANALSDETGAILVCHRSNFEMVGFVSEPAVSQLSELGVPVVDDFGTGCMIDLQRFGLTPTKTFSTALRNGADLVIGSGDKLLGGPQAGIIVGSSELIARIRRHPLARALRIDKFTVAALEETLNLYLNGRESEIPTINYISRSATSVRSLCKRLARAISVPTVTEACQTEVGGGSGASSGIPSYRVGFPNIDAEDLASRLRSGKPAVIGRIENGTFWLDARCIESTEVKIVAEQVNRCLN